VQQLQVVGGQAGVPVFAPEPGMPFCAPPPAPRAGGHRR